MQLVCTLCDNQCAIGEDAMVMALPVSIVYSWYVDCVVYSDSV